MDGLPDTSEIPKARSPEEFVISKSLVISATSGLPALIFHRPAASVLASAYVYPKTISSEVVGFVNEPPVSQVVWKFASGPAEMTAST
jgi:hypothetical protein